MFRFSLFNIKIRKFSPDFFGQKKDNHLSKSQSVKIAKTPKEVKRNSLLHYFSIVLKNPILNKLSPSRVLASGLSIFPDTPLMAEIKRGEFIEADETEKIKELKTFVSSLNIQTVLDAANVSNLAPVFGILPDDKDKILNILNADLDKYNEQYLRFQRKNMSNL